MQCPKDLQVLHETILCGQSVSVCSVCNGLWLSGDEFKSIVQHFSDTLDSTDVLKQWQVVDGDGVTSPRNFWSEDTLLCPVDSCALRKHYFAGSQIGLDNCERCNGFWLDGDELTAVTELAAPNVAENARGALLISNITDSYSSAGEEYDARVHAFKIASTAFYNPMYSFTALGLMIARYVVEQMTKRN